MDPSHASTGRPSAREARRRWVMVPFLLAVVGGAIGRLLQRGGGWLGWAAVVALCAAGVVVFLRDAARPGTGPSRRQWRFWLAFDALYAVLFLTRESLAWPVRVVTCAVLLLMTLALWFDQRGTTWPED